MDSECTKKTFQLAKLRRWRRYERFVTSRRDKKLTYDITEQQIYASDLLFVVSLTASKLAVALLLFRLSSVRRTILASYALMGVIGAWGTASLLAVAIRPQLSQPWILDNEDASHVVRVDCKFVVLRQLTYVNRWTSGPAWERSAS